MSRRVNDYRTNEKEVMVLLDDLRVCEFLGLHAGVELCVLDADPLLRDDGDDVVPAHHLLALPPQVVDPELHVRHACNVYIPCTVYSTQRTQRAGQDEYTPLRKPRKNSRTLAICFSTEPSASCSTYSSSTAVICTCSATSGQYRRCVCV